MICNINDVMINGQSITSTSYSPQNITAGSSGTTTYMTNKLENDILDLKSENYALKEELKDLRATVKLLGDSLIEHADEHKRKKRKK